MLTDVLRTRDENIFSSLVSFRINNFPKPAVLRLPWGLRNYHYAAPQLVRAIRSGFEKSYNHLQCYSALHGILYKVILRRFCSVSTFLLPSFPQSAARRGRPAGSRELPLYFVVIPAVEPESSIGVVSSLPSS